MIDAIMRICVTQTQHERAPGIGGYTDAWGIGLAYLGTPGLPTHLGDIQSD